MQKYFKTLLVILLLSATGCQKSDNAEQLLQNENKRMEVYNAILENEELRYEMMDMMRERNTGGKAGPGGIMADSAGTATMNQQQLRTRMQEMMTLCQTDTAACSMMAQLMLQNSGMTGSLIKHMQQRGILDSTCLQQMSSQLKQK